MSPDNPVQLVCAVILLGGVILAALSLFLAAGVQAWRGSDVERRARQSRKRMAARRAARDMETARILAGRSELACVRFWGMRNGY